MGQSPRLKRDEHFTYSDYLTWPDDEKWELIDGVAYDMSPAPGRRHQELVGELFRLVANYLKGKSCKVYSAPFDVRISESANKSDNYVDTVVQPDIVVVCDLAKLDDRGCKGAPDLVMEISSPGTAGHDLKEKFDLYQKTGVKEYWVVHPTDRTVMVFKLNNIGEYGRPDMYGYQDRVDVTLLGDLIIDLNEVFAA